MNPGRSLSDPEMLTRTRGRLDNNATELCIRAIFELGNTSQYCSVRGNGNLRLNDDILGLLVLYHDDKILRLTVEELPEL